MTINVKDYAYKVTAAGRVNIIGEHVDYRRGKGQHHRRAYRLLRRQGFPRGARV